MAENDETQLRALIRLMRRRRDEVVADVHRQVEAHRRNQKNQARKSRDAA